MAPSLWERRVSRALLPRAFASLTSFACRCLLCSSPPIISGHFSVPLRLQTASETLAQKAIAAGFIGEQVDGNDVVAMHAAAKDAIEAARNYQGPRFIEAVTYRLGDHTTADDAARYRSATEVQARWKEEPIARLRSFLAGQKVWSKTDEEQLSAECQQHIDAAVERYLVVKPRAPETMFDHLYAELPRAYAAQRRELEEND